MRISFCSKCGKRLTDVDLQGTEPAADASSQCRDCSSTATAIPVSSRNLPSDSKLKAARRNSESGIPAARKEPGLVAAAGGPGGSSWPKEKHRRANASKPVAAGAVPIVACVTAALAIVLVYALTRDHGKPKDKEDDEKPLAQVQAAPVKPQPAAPHMADRKPAPPAIVATPEPAPKPPQHEAPEPAKPLEEPAKSVEQPNPLDPPKETVSADPEPKVAEEPAKSAEPAPETKESSKTASTVEEDEEDVLPAKVAQPKDMPPVKEPKAVEPPPAVAAEAARRKEEFEQKLRRAEWISILNKDDQDRWDLAKAGCWKVSGDVVSGNARITHKDLMNFGNYEMKAEVQLQKGTSMTMIMRHDDDACYRISITDKDIEGQLYDMRQKKVKRTFEKVTVDTKNFVKIHVQSKGKWLRVLVNDKDVVLEFADVPQDKTQGFWFYATQTSKGAFRNVQFRPLF